MTETQFLVVWAGVGLFFLWLGREPFIPMPKWKRQREFTRLVKKNTYSPKEGIPFVWLSKRKTKRMKQLNERVQEENKYLENLRTQERLKAARRRRHV